MIRRRSKGSEIPEAEDLATFRQIINDAFSNELGSCEALELVEEAGPETLVVRAVVTDIVTDIVSKSAKTGENPKPFAAQGDVFFDLIDAETGVIQARVGERRKSGRGDDGAVPPDAGAQWANIWTWAEEAASELRRELERVRSENRG